MVCDTLRKRSVGFFNCTNCKPYLMWRTICGSLTSRSNRTARPVSKRDDAGADSEEIFMVVAGCLEQSMWCKAAGHRSSSSIRGPHDQEGTVCQVVSRVMEKMAALPKGAFFFFFFAV